VWPDAVDEILGGDQAVALATVTPARGVIITPLTNFAIRDRDAATLEAINTSVGLWKKLERVERNPQVALAYHTREHGYTDRPEYVLVQGRATHTPLDDRDYLPRNREQWDRFADPVDTNPLWKRWRRVYHWRAAITVQVERVIVWPDLSCRGTPVVHGTPLPEDPPPQSPPGKGTGPRVDHERIAKRAQRLPYVLLGWAGADGYPMVVPTEATGATANGITLSGPMPPGARRAGLTAHWFAPKMVGQEQRIHTGWLDEGVYAPHTKAGYRFPESPFLFKLLSGLTTRTGLRAARRAGFIRTASR
jgi:Pyridoxamine 5'-phosphate oxidase